VSPVIHSVRTHLLTGRRVVVVRIVRAGRTLRTDAAIEDLRGSDAVETGLVLSECGGAARVSWVTFMVPAEQLGRIEGQFEGKLGSGVIREPTSGTAAKRPGS
jgi:hypothetical protein